MGGMAQLAAVGCSESPGDLAAPALSYPPVVDLTEVVVPVDPSTSEVVAIALDSSILRLHALGRDEAARGKLKSMVAPDANLGPPSTWAGGPPGYVSTTGVRTSKAVALTSVGSGRFQVSICRYPTPGLWSVLDDGSLLPSPVDSEHLYSLITPIVEWTSEPSADGTKPDVERWLVVDNGVNDATTEQAAAACRPHLPEPQPVVPPDPLPPDPGGTP